VCGITSVGCIGATVVLEKLDDPPEHPLSARAMANRRPKVLTVFMIASLFQE
jgi:hypothetical protein